MDRKEAIKTLEHLYEYYDFGQMEKPGHEALNMAIRCLKVDEMYGLEYEKSLHEVEAEDCRSLKDIKEMIERKADALDGQMLDAGGICIGLYFAIANDLPTVYPKSDKPIRSHWHGHWIDCDKNDDYSADGYDCSVCGVNAEYATSYCPNCGAKMDGEEQTDGNDGQ